MTTYQGRIAPVFGSASGDIRFYIACYMSHGNHCAKKFTTKDDCIKFLQRIGQYQS